MRATMSKYEFHYRVYVDDLYVGRGDFEVCKELVNELNESDEKCDSLI